METYKEFMIEEISNNSHFRVYVKTFFWWSSAHLMTDFFSIWYDSFEEANEAIEEYKKRLTVIKD